LVLSFRRGAPPQATIATVAARAAKRWILTGRA
jgi:hypothetical protein